MQELETKLSSRSQKAENEIPATGVVYNTGTLRWGLQHKTFLIGLCAAVLDQCLKSHERLRESGFSFWLIQITLS